MSDNDWGIDPEDITLPQFAAPNDPAIVIGTALPPCMQSFYSAAFFFRPGGTIGTGLNGPPYMYLAQKKIVSGTAEIVEMGWVIYDPSGGVCGYVPFAQFDGVNSGAGSIATFVTFGNRTPVGLPAQQPMSFSVGSAPGNTETQFNIGVASLDPFQSPFFIDSVSAPRGLRAFVSSTVNSAPIAAEAVTLTSPAFTAYSNRAYEWEILGLYTATTPNGAQLQVRDTNLAGATLGQNFFAINAISPIQDGQCVGVFRRPAGTNRVGMNVVATLQSTAGNNTAIGTPTAVRSLAIRDCGAATDYPNAPTV